MNEERRYANAQALAEALSIAVADDLRAGIQSRGAGVLLLSPRPGLVPFFQSLREQVLDWPRVSIMLTDDAWVAPASEHSGERLLRQQLVQGEVLDASLIPLWTARCKPIEALAGLGERLAALPRPFDAAVLAPGSTGEIAGLHDGTPALDAMLKPDWAVKLAPTLARDAPRERITLTLSALLDARRVYLVNAQDIPQAPDERARSVEALLRQRRTALCVLHTGR